MNLRRTDFETRSSELFQKVVSIVKSAIEQSGLDISEIHSIEVHGGAVRIPKLLDTLTENIGRPVQRTLNGDEAAVLGAAFHAARVSGQFAAKSFAINDTLPYNVTFSFSPKHSEGQSEKPQEIKHHSLFMKSSWPSTKSVSVNRTDDFQMTFYGPNGPLQNLKVTGLHSELEGLGHFSADRNPKNSALIRIEAKLDASGVLGVSSVKLKYKEWKAPAAAPNEPAPEGEDAPEEPIAETTEPIKHDIPLQLEWEYIGRRPLTTTEFETEKRLLMEQKKHEAAKRAVAQAKNDLEALIIGYEGETLESLKQSVPITAEHEQKLTSILNEVKEWFYEGEGLTEESVDAYQSQIYKITSLVDDIRMGSEVPEEQSEESTEEAGTDENTDDIPSEL